MSSGTRVAGALAAVAAVLLAGCATVPTSGPIRQGEDLRLDRADAAVPFIATPPRPGATPEEVVRGFLRANADFRDDHFVARQHLTPQARQRWKTTAHTTVYEPVEVLADEPDPATVTVNGSEIARIDAEGSYRRTPADTPLSRTYQLASVAGEWRIASLEDGLVLSEVDVKETFRQVSLYFLSPSRDVLVPDTILLPELPGLSTKLVSRLLDGPTAELRSAVDTAIPQGTDLEVQSVPIRDGLATVPLNVRARGADDDARQQMAAQIVWTLKQLGPEIERVRITSGGDDLVVSGAPEEQPRESWPTFDPNGMLGTSAVYAVRDGVVGRFVESKFATVPGPAGSGDLRLRTPAVSRDQSRLAAVSADGRSLYTGRLADGAPFDRIAAGGDLGRPSWDRQGNLWFLDRSTGAVAVLPEGATQPVSVTVGKLPGGKATQVLLARDGTRMALVTGTGPGARLVLAAVTGTDRLDPESAGTAKVSVLAAREVVPDLRGVRDVAWADAQTLAVIGSRAGLPAAVMYTSTDGYEIEPVRSGTDLVTIAAAPPLRAQSSPLVVGTGEGQLLQPTLGVGDLLGEGTDPTFPG